MVGWGDSSPPQAQGGKLEAQVQERARGSEHQGLEREGCGMGSTWGTLTGSPGGPAGPMGPVAPGIPYMTGEEQKLA